LRIPALVVLTVALCMPALAADPYSSARKALDAGRADDALAVLGNDASPIAENLRCRVYYSEERWDLAVQACEASVRGNPNSSDFHLWLGRAYGEKADHASFITAYDLAKHVAREFEAAVQLDKRNLEALSDLGEFYAEAPSVVGGGRDKARKVAATLQGLDPSRYHLLLARIAEREHDYAKTDNEIHLAIRAAPDPSEGWFDLASFYRRQARWPEMLDAVHKGQATDVHHGPTLLDGAQNLRRSGRELDLASALVRTYLNGGHLSEAAPAFRAHWLLGDLLEMRGDHAAAQVEYSTATALAKNYKPSGK
jgi:tetratricopeptide (TPR) repeat protein